jgi:perosamine synthetase
MPSVLDAGLAIKVTSGRTAIALALKHMNIAEGDEVLVPAYHCTSMIEPVTWASATPVFYRINNDTSLNLDHMEQIISRSCRALLITHYFGFPQNLQQIREFCDRHKLILIEDCAHAFFGEYNGRPLGSVGDYAICSSMKFFPTYDGGCLISSRETIKNIRLDSAGPAFEAKAVVNTLEHSLEYRRLNAIRYLLKLPLIVKDALWKRFKSKRPDASDRAIGPGASEGAYEFDPRWLNTGMSIWSRIIMTASSWARIVDRRRRNYLIFLRELSGVPGGTPLFTELPEGVAPYVFPFRVDEPERVFPILKQQGVPILRFGEYLWPGVDSNTCPISIDLSRRIFQFPCHQELRHEEITWMIARIREALQLHGTQPANNKASQGVSP